MTCAKSSKIWEVPLIENAFLHPQNNMGNLLAKILSCHSPLASLKILTLCSVNKKEKKENNVAYRHVRETVQCKKSAKQSSC